MSSQSSTPDQGGRRAAPTSLRVAVGVVVVEALALAVLGVLEVLHLDSLRLTMGVTTAVFFLGYAAALLLCAWGLLRLVPWGRGPAVLTQLIGLGLAWSFRDDPLVALALVACAVVALVGLLHPATTAALDDEGL